MEQMKRHPIDPHRPVQKGLVSIMMPILNGELFLADALDCLCNQDYQNFELIILDNQSTDKTPEICKAYAEQDHRIRYVLDEKSRISHDAANHLATLVHGEFSMLACDDDLWEKNFLSQCVAYLDTHQDVGLVFPNACFVNMAGEKGMRRLLRGGDVYHAGRKSIDNFRHFLFRRRIVPPVFGVYRTSVMQKALPFDTFDETIADVDNLFMLEVMLLARVHCLDKVLFYYRSKYRAYEPSLLKGLKKDNSWLDRWKYNARHQLNFTRKICSTITNSSLPEHDKKVLSILTWLALLYFTTWVPVRSLIGAWLIRLGFREGPAQQKDQLHDVRTAALKQAKFEELIDKD